MLSHRLEHRVPSHQQIICHGCCPKEPTLVSHETFLICERWKEKWCLTDLRAARPLCGYLQAWSEDGGRPRDHIRWAASHQGLSSPLQHCKWTLLFLIEASAWRWLSRLQELPAYQETSVPDTAACSRGNSIEPGKGDHEEILCCDITILLFQISR